MLVLLIPAALSAKGKGYRGKLISLYKTVFTDPQIDLDQYENMVNAPEQWFMENRMIAHGLGEIEGNTTTNSREAFESSLAKGIVVFETDIALTADGKAVLSHEFDGFSERGNIPSYEQFMEGKLVGKYTPLDLSWILSALEEHPEIFIMTDMKSDCFEQVCRDLVAGAMKLNREDLLQRIIIQIYNEEDLETTKRVYPFPNILFSTYKSGYLSQKEAAEFCLRNKIPVITQGAMKNKADYLRYFNEKNIKVFAFTVNTEEMVSDLAGIGYWGFYSDILTQKELDSE